MMMPVLYRRFRIMKHANFLLAFAFYQREARPSLREGEEQASGYQPSFLSFLSLSFSSLDTTSRSDEEELANDNVHTQGVQIYSRIHEHTQGVESL